MLSLTWDMSLCSYIGHKSGNWITTKLKIFSVSEKRDGHIMAQRRDGLYFLHRTHTISRREY